MPRLLCLLAVLLAPAALSAAAPPQISTTAHGDRLRDDYFRLQAKKLAADALADVKSKEDWQKKQPQMRRQFLDMLGLWPLPPRTDLKATVTGKVETKTYVVEKLHFQSVPGLYVSANLYLPKKVTAPCPAVLYVCGHGASVVDRISYGNKVTYQHHAIWFAENGYVCLVVDTLQLGELAGLHHGTSRFGMWWWLSLGYTPAGIECWNGMRAIFDYLTSRKEVDAKRIGVTGRSGGGATSWWVGAADERVKCIVPVAGIADLRAPRQRGLSGPPGRRRRRGSLRLHVPQQHLSLGLYPGDRVVRPAATAAGQQRRRPDLPRARLSAHDGQGEEEALRDARREG